jgi:hypothetical protein
MHVISAPGTVDWSSGSGRWSPHRQVNKRTRGCYLKNDRWLPNKIPRWPAALIKFRSKNMRKNRVVNLWFGSWIPYDLCIGKTFSLSQSRDSVSLMVNMSVHCSWVLVFLKHFSTMQNETKINTYGYINPSFCTVLRMNYSSLNFLTSAWWDRKRDLTRTEQKYRPSRQYRSILGKALPTAYRRRGRNPCRPLIPYHGTGKIPRIA